MEEYVPHGSRKVKWRTQNYFQNFLQTHLGTQKNYYAKRRYGGATLVDLKNFTAETLPLLGIQRARRIPKNNQNIIKIHTNSKICFLVYNIDTHGWGILYLGLKGVSHEILNNLLRGKPKEWVEPMCQKELMKSDISLLV